MEDFKQKEKKYDCFISHASEDKADFVEELVVALENKGLSVWYDSQVLNIGDSLRESIDKGLNESTCGIVILSKNFFAKHWTDYELNGLFARQNSDGKKIILPIWHNITTDEVREYSPSLSDIVAGNSKSGVETVARSIVKSIINIKSNSQTLAYSSNKISRDAIKIIEQYEQNVETFNSEEAKKIVENLVIDKKNIIKTNKFFNNQLSELLNVLTDDYGNIAKLQPDNKLLYERTLVYDGYCEKLLTSIICGSYWGENAFDKLWSNIFKNLAKFKIMEQGYTSLINFQRYPSLLLYYALLLVSLLKENFELIRYLFYGFDTNENNNEPICPIKIYYPEYIIPKQIFNSILQQKYYTPVNDHIHDILRPLFTEYIQSDAEYSNLFDRVEYLISLEYFYYNVNSNVGQWFPLGRYNWRYECSNGFRKNHPFHYFDNLANEGNIFKFGLLGKSCEKYSSLIDEFKQKLAEIYFI